MCVYVWGWERWRVNTLWNWWGALSCTCGSNQIITSPLHLCRVQEIILWLLHHCLLMEAFWIILYMYWTWYNLKSVNITSKTFLMLLCHLWNAVTNDFIFQVCKKAFANIHGISDKKIRTLCIKHEQNILFPRDNRGRHRNRPKKVGLWNVGTVCSYAD